MKATSEPHTETLGILFWRVVAFRKAVCTESSMYPLLLSCLASRLLGEEDGLDVGKDAALSDGHA